MTVGASALVLLVGAAVAVAGCGPTKSPSVVSEGTSAAGPGQTQLEQQLLDYARCMRANGVPDFPDPSPTGGFQVRGNPSSPSFRTAQAKCQKLVPLGGNLAPGATSHPSAQWLAQMLADAECMRNHGISGFPDPRTSVPSNLAGVREVSDIEGAIFVFPNSIDTQSPAFVRAAGTCRFALHNH